MKTNLTATARLVLPMFILIIMAALTAQAATLTVTNTDDSGAGSLRQAILDAAAGDTVDFNLAGCPCLITLLSGELIIDKSLTIQGPGASQLTVSGGNISRVFNAFGDSVTLDGLTITRGNGAGGLGTRGGNIVHQLNGTLVVRNSIVSNSFDQGIESGGGIHNAGGTLVVTGTTVTGNVSTFGGGIFNDSGTVIITDSNISGNRAVIGGGIYNIATLSVVGTTISGNSTFTTGGNRGGGIFNSGSATIVNSTISGNASDPNRTGAGGGIFNTNSVILINSTISGNSACGGCANGSGGGINNQSTGTINAANTIIAGNSSRIPDFRGTLNSLGYNLIGNAANTIIIGDATGNILNVDARLAPLADNGGPTLTHALLADSPAINAGSNALALDANGNPLTTDQRGAGFPRIIGTVDIGAFEELLPNDSTPPVISPTVSGTLGNNDWYVSDVNVSWAVTDADSAISNQTGCDSQTVTTDTSGVTFTCTATSNGGTASQSVTFKRDATNPTINFVSRTPAANANGWNNSNVTVNWNCADNLSGTVSPTNSRTVATEGLNQSAIGTCTDNAGNSASNTQSGINIDFTPPTLAPTVSPNPVMFNNPATASANASDALSGIASQSCGAVNTSTIGNQTVACTATDLAGNTANANANYQVIKANQTISFAPIGNRTFGDAPFGLTAVASSGLPVGFQIIAGSAALNGNILTITGVGQVTVRAVQPGNGNYNPAPNVDQTFTVAKATPTLTLTAPAVIINGGNITLSAGLTGVGGAPLANRTVVFSIGSGTAAQSCTATTVANGTASCVISNVAQPAGTSVSVRATFTPAASDTNYNGATATANANAFGTAVVTRDEPKLNGGRIVGGLRLLTGEDFNINSGTTITDLFLPGTPNLRRNSGTFGTIVSDGGSTSPSNYEVKLNGGTITTTHRQSLPIAFPANIPTSVPAATGTRNVVINNAADVGNIGNWATVRSLTVNAPNVTINVPAGNYHSFTVNGSNSLLRFTAGTYNFADTIKLNGNSRIEVTGRTTINIGESLTLNGGRFTLGGGTTATDVTLNVIDGDLTVNANSEINADVRVPSGEVKLNGGNAIVRGNIWAEEFTLNSNSQVICATCINGGSN